MLKRLFDIVFSFLGLALLWPLLLLIALLIRVKMPVGPVFYCQQRVGREGKLFTMVKFRSMLVGNDASSISVAGEPRITPLGAKLRRWKLDELPELWNVLKGEMSFVGPRPDVQGYADKLEGEDRVVLRLRPGITGPASLRYRNEEEILAAVEDPKAYNDAVIFPDKVRINREYYSSRTFWGDVKIILMTIGIVPLPQNYCEDRRS